MWCLNRNWPIFVVAYICLEFWETKGRGAGVDVGRVPSPRREGCGTSLAPSSEKMIFFIWNDVFRCILSGTFSRAFVIKMLNFPFEVMVWSLLVDVEDVLWKCNASYLILEILKQDKIWGGQFALGFQAPNSGDEATLCPVIYAHICQFQIQFRHCHTALDIIMKVFFIFRRRCYRQPILSRSIYVCLSAYFCRCKRLSGPGERLA